LPGLIQDEKNVMLKTLSRNRCPSTQVVRNHCKLMARSLLQPPPSRAKRSSWYVRRRCLLSARIL